MYLPLNSQLTASLVADYSAFQPTGKGRFSLKSQASVGMVDVLSALKPYISAAQHRQMAEMSRKLTGGNPIELQFNAEGNMRHLAVQRASVGVAGLARVAADGFVRNAMDKRRMEPSISPSIHSPLIAFVPCYLPI